MPAVERREAHRAHAAIFDRCPSCGRRDVRNSTDAHAPYEGDDEVADDEARRSVDGQRRADRGRAVHDRGRTLGDLGSEQGRQTEDREGARKHEQALASQQQS